MVRFYKTLFTIILTTSFVFSQTENKCNSDYIKRVKIDSCDYVEMSTYRFAYYYKAEKNLKKVQQYADSLHMNLDSLNNLTQKIDSSFNAEIDTLRSQKTTLMTSMEECVSLSVDLELENIELIDENEKLKSVNKKLAISTTGSVILFIITLIIAL